MNPEKEYTILEESKQYYILQATGDQDPICVAKRDYTPPKAAVWKDVTAACEVRSTGLLYWKSEMVNGGPGYRIVPLMIQGIGGVIGKEPGDFGRQLTVRNVFVVERKETA